MTTKKWFWWISLILATVVCLSAWIYVMLVGSSIVSILALYVVTIGVIMGWVQIL